MKIEILQKVDSNEWDKMLIILGGTIKHSTSWAKFYGIVSQRTPLFAVSKDETNQYLLAMAICFIEQSKRPILSALSQSIFLEAFPIVKDNDSEMLKAFIISLESYLAKEGYRQLTIESTQSKLTFKDIPMDNYDKDERYEFYLDLSKDDEVLWKNLKESHRRKIRTGQKEQLIVRQSRGIEDFFKLQELQKNSSLQATKRGENYEVGNRDYYINLKKYLTDYGFAKLYLAEIENEIVSGALVTLYNGQAYYMHGGSNTKGFELGSSYLLFFEIIKDLKQNHFSIFNLGGVPKESENPESNAYGLYRFKRGFGCEIVSCMGGTKILNPVKNKIYTMIRR